MADLEKVIKGIEMCISPDECSPDECPYYDRPDNASGLCWDRLMTDALALLKEQEADKWIPVTERLPEVRHAVLCYSPHHINIWALSLHEDGEWYYWIPMYQKYNPDFEGPITHWMPLPEPPKEGR